MSDHFVGDLAVDFLHEGIPQLHLTSRSGHAPDAHLASADTAFRRRRNAAGTAGASEHPQQGRQSSAATITRCRAGRRSSRWSAQRNTVTVMRRCSFRSIRSAASVVKRSRFPPGFARFTANSIRMRWRGRRLTKRFAIWSPSALIPIRWRCSTISAGAARICRIGWASLVRCAQGCYDAALAYGAPFISGKDSLNNEYNDVDGTRHAIPGTLLISAIGHRAGRCADGHDRI